MPRKQLNPLYLLLGAGAGLAAGWVIGQSAWILKQLMENTAPRTLANPPQAPATGRAFATTTDGPHWRREHTIDDGIERIVYIPKNRRFQTPIVMQHGMWHGAWCWQTWQEALAEWGWESHAHSLPGHGASPVQRPIALCTLDYYLAFLKAEIDRVTAHAGRRPILMGHSMGGALTQWYLRHVGDDLPAAVLVAPWASHNSMEDGLPRFLKLDPLGAVFTSLTWHAAYTRSPYRAARALTSPDSIYPPEELFGRLGPESALVMMQHNPPFWHPAENVRTPLLWLAGSRDAVIGVDVEWRSANHYGATFRVYDGAHNLMMEPTHRTIAEDIHGWLARQEIK